MAAPIKLHSFFSFQELKVALRSPILMSHAVTPSTCINRCFTYSTSRSNFTSLRKSNSNVCSSQGNFSFMFKFKKLNDGSDECALVKRVTAGMSINKCGFQTCAPHQHGDFEWKDPISEDEVVNVTYVLSDGEEVKVRGKVGDNAMYLAHRYNIPMEGACEASLACCTCHVYVDEEYFDRIQEPLEEEEDMLDMAPFLQTNSRLGCQITLNKDLEGLVLRLPQATRNFYVDGHVPEPH